MSNFLNVDPRILDFRKDVLILPERFLAIDERKMILACGDGNQRGLDLRDYKRRHDDYCNIFCCAPDYNSEGLAENISYLMDNPRLNIILCLFDFENVSHLEKLLNLFENSIYPTRAQLKYAINCSIRFY